MSDEHDAKPEDRPLPPPALPGEAQDTVRSGATLEELLELASRAEAARFGTGTLVGECLDTHNPYRPRRVLVRARDEDGKPVTAWLPVLAQLRVEVGHKVLLSKPDNWPEPVVIGSIAGLEPAPDEAPDQTSQAEPALRLEQGQALAIADAEGRPLVELRSTVDGPQIVMLQPDVSLDTSGRLRIGADRIELHAREGGVDIRTEGEAVVRARLIRLN